MVNASLGASTMLRRSVVPKTKTQDGQDQSLFVRDCCVEVNVRWWYRQTDQRWQIQSVDQYSSLLHFHIYKHQIYQFSNRSLEASHQGSEKTRTAMQIQLEHPSVWDPCIVLYGFDHSPIHTMVLAAPPMNRDRTMTQYGSANMMSSNDPMRTITPITSGPRLYGCLEKNHATGKVAKILSAKVARSFNKEDQTWV